MSMQTKMEEYIQEREELRKQIAPIRKRLNWLRAAIAIRKHKIKEQEKRKKGK